MKVSFKNDPAGKYIRENTYSFIYTILMDLLLCPDAAEYSMRNKMGSLFLQGYLPEVGETPRQIITSTNTERGESYENIEDKR